MGENKRIIIAAHYLLYGAGHALRDYLLSKKTKLVSSIFLPLASQRKVFITSHKSSKLTFSKTQDRSKNLGILDYFIDVYTILSFVIKQRPYDVYVGCDPLNCISGLMLRSIGKAKRVIFYSIDFVPIRFENKLLNSIYHQLEIYCVKNADEVWNVSPRIAEGREKFLHISASQYPQKVVPIGIWNDKIKKRPIAQIKKHQILFMGHLLEKQGVQAVLDALPAVVKKIKDAQLVVVGGGEYKHILEEKVRKLSLQKYVAFVGWINERVQIDEMMSESAIAVATYKPEKKQLYNFTYYADPTKLKDYLGAGLPIVLTDISYNAKIIQEKKCGILVKYDKVEIAKAIIDILSDEKKLIEYRKNALAYANEFEWDNIFRKAISLGDRG